MSKIKKPLLFIGIFAISFVEFLFVAFFVGLVNYIGVEVAGIENFETYFVMFAIAVISLSIAVIEYRNRMKKHTDKSFGE